MTTLPNCPFCLIGLHQAPAYIIWENSNYLAILDIHPYVPGHTLVIPKEHVPYYWEMNYDDWKDYMVAVKTVTDLIRQKTQCERVNLRINGIEIPHVHIHLVPSSTPGWDDLPLPEIADKLR